MIIPVIRFTTSLIKLSRLLSKHVQIDGERLCKFIFSMNVTIEN